MNFSNFSSENPKVKGESHKKEKKSKSKSKEKSHTKNKYHDAN